MKHKVISVKQPWSFLICSCIKDIENRTWKLPEKYKGQRVLIHASGDKRPDVRLRHLAGMLNQSQFDEINEKLDRSWPFMKVNTFAIIGSVGFVDCRISHPSIWAEKTEVYNSWCKSNGCENYIEWGTGHGECVSCKLVGQSYNIYEIADKCPFKKDAKKPIYNWVVADPILFDKPILDIKGKLGFWDYDLPEEYEKLLK